jgi:hypothetical protein
MKFNIKTTEKESAGLSMVKLIFYGGVNEIGGNKILLEDKKDTRAILTTSWRNANSGLICSLM